MDAARRQRIEEICDEALDYDPAERSAFLVAQCGADHALRQEVEALLVHAREAAGFLAAFESDAAGRLPERNQPSGAASEELPIWARVVIAVAVIRIAVALTLYLSAPLPIVPRAALPPAVLPPWWIYAALSLTFMALGLGLAFANRRDSRAAWLGGILTLTGVPFATPLLEASGAPTWLINVRPEALSGALCWCFLARFPSRFESRNHATVVHLIAIIAALIGLWCAIASLAVVWYPVAVRWPWLALFGVGAGSLYWPLILALAAPTFPVLVWRAAMAEGEARHQIRLFVTGLLIGFAPFTVQVFIEEIVPAYKSWAHSPEVAPWIGSLIFGAIATVPFVTTYSVLFDRVVDLRVVLRAAAQYILARYTIVVVTLVPFAALAIFLHAHRSEPIVSLVTGARPLLLGSVATVGLVSFRLRSRWLDLLDRRYFRESYEAHEILTRVMDGMQATNPGQLAAAIRLEIERALHSDADVFLIDETRTALRHVEERLPSIAVTSKVVDLAFADARPMDIDLEHSQSLLSRLPEEEQHWLRRGNFSLLVSLRRGSGGVEGLFGLGRKRSGLPFTDDDRRLLSAMASAASLGFDSLRLRSTPATPVDLPARECVECGRLSSSETKRCECGGEVAPANVPHVLRGVFRFKQRIGAGGMGVVYKAGDITLGRDVAIKALPRVTPELIARLRREARAMAALSHPNLAVIHGVETWQGMPFLVQEYLGGGTLAQRLNAARPAIRDSLDLGVTLADVLRYMHTSGVVHCDIKPSNIGFTHHGTVKLLDFGLARVMRDARSGATTLSHSTVASASVQTDTLGGWFGTPHFMSPEAARGEPAAPSFDLWALAVVLYEMISGCRPFDGEDAWAILARIRAGPSPNIRHARPDVPESVAAFFDSALAAEPSRRPADASALSSALQRIRDDTM